MCHRSYLTHKETAVNQFLHRDTRINYEYHITDRRHKRERFEFGIGIRDCAPIGGYCGIVRASPGSDLVMSPCCERLTCFGMVPRVRRDDKGKIIDIDENSAFGICSLNLDDNRTRKELGAYIKG